MYVNGSAASHFVVIDTPNEAETAWSGALPQNQGRANTVEFRAAQACSGFDETIDPHRLMVGMPASGSTTPGLNTAKATFHGNIQQDVNFVSDNTSVTVTSDGAKEPNLTVTAALALDPTNTMPVTIKAVSRANADFVYGKMEVVVKPRLTAQNFHMYKITESVRNLVPPNVPTAAALSDYLNNITWGRQANVFFNVQATDPVLLSVHYDLIPAPNGDGKLNDFTLTGGSVETTAIAQAILNVDPLAGGSIDHTWVGYINQFGPDTTCTTCTLEGLSFTGDHISFVQGMQAGGANSRVNVTAHEIGHGLHRQNNDVTSPKTENRSLMWKTKGTGDPNNPCEIGIANGGMSILRRVTIKCDASVRKVIMVFRATLIGLLTSSLLLAQSVPSTSNKEKFATQELQEILCGLDFGPPFVRVAAISKLEYVRGWFAINTLSRFLEENPKYLRKDSDSRGIYASPRFYALQVLSKIVPDPPLGEPNGTWELASPNKDAEQRVLVWKDFLAKHHDQLLRLEPSGEGIVSSPEICRGVWKRKLATTKKVFGDDVSYYRRWKSGTDELNPDPGVKSLWARPSLRKTRLTNLSCDCPA
jgi:hypothetical protein